jgi:uncharacterized membrane protein (DUF485 family)
MAEQTYNWSAIAKNPKFIELHHKKTAFLFGWWIFSTIYYFLLPIGAAYAPGLFKIQILGRINFGYICCAVAVFCVLGPGDVLCPCCQQGF